MRSERKRHKWKDVSSRYFVTEDECVHCRCLRFKTWCKIRKWYVFEYADKETGEIVNSLSCKTIQYKLML